MRKPSRSLSNRLINPTKRFATPAEGLEMMTKRFGMPVRYAGFAIRRNSWYRICNPNCPRGVADYNRLLRPTVPQRLITADCKSAVTKSAVTNGAGTPCPYALCPTVPQAFYSSPMRRATSRFQHSMLERAFSARKGLACAYAAIFFS